jgi:heptosyltransferase II
MTLDSGRFSAEPEAGRATRPLRLLVVCPSWVGDVVMATPAMRLLRSHLPGTLVGALVRPGIDELLAGTDLFDELHVDRAVGIMGPKLVAAKIRPRQYDTALLLTNSFSTALIARLAFIPRRVGYDRDGRGVLLTDRIVAQRRVPPHRGYACVPAVDYYLVAARALLRLDEPQISLQPARLELATTPAQDAAAAAVLSGAGVGPGEPRAIVNPGANDAAKRWPADRFAAAAVHLVREHGLAVLVNGSPAEAELARTVVHAAREQLAPDQRRKVADLTGAGVTIGSLKGVVRSSRVMLTNDTGPRHIAAAMGVPTVTLFGPTDPRWTMLPPSPGHRSVELVAEHDLPDGVLADDEPERCRIDRIEVATVLAALGEVLSAREGAGRRGRGAGG